jgi:hypothetical protein
MANPAELEYWILKKPDGVDVCPTPAHLTKKLRSRSLLLGVLSKATA